MNSPRYILDIYMEQPKVQRNHSINERLNYIFENKELYKCREEAFKKIRDFESIFIPENYPGIANIISSFSRSDKIRFRNFTVHSVCLAMEYQTSYKEEMYIPIYGYGINTLDSLTELEWLRYLEVEFGYYKKNKHKLPDNIITRRDEDSGIIATLSMGYEEFMRYEETEDFEELVDETTFELSV